MRFEIGFAVKYDIIPTATIPLIVTERQPTYILPGRRTFPSPGKSGIAQARRGCLARWHQAGGGDEEQEGGAGGGGGEEHHACGLRPLLLGLYEATVN